MTPCPFCGDFPKITRSSDIVKYGPKPGAKYTRTETGWTYPLIEIERWQSWHLECCDHVSMFAHSQEELIEKWETRV